MDDPVLGTVPCGYRFIAPDKRNPGCYVRRATRQEIQKGEDDARRCRPDRKTDHGRRCLHLQQSLGCGPSQHAKKSAHRTNSGKYLKEGGKGPILHRGVDMTSSNYDVSDYERGVRNPFSQAAVVHQDKERLKRKKCLQNCMQKVLGSDAQKKRVCGEKCPQLEFDKPVTQKGALGGVGAGSLTPGIVQTDCNTLKGRKRRRCKALQRNQAKRYGKERSSPDLPAGMESAACDPNDPDQQLYQDDQGRNYKCVNGKYEILTGGSDRWGAAVTQESRLKELIKKELLG